MLLGYIAEFLQDSAESLSGLIHPGYRQSLAQVLGAALRMGQLHYAGNEFCELVGIAAESMPILTNLRPHDLPCPVGVMYYEKPTVAGSEWMVLWLCTPDRDGGIFVIFMNDRASKMRMWEEEDDDQAYTLANLDPELRRKAVDMTPEFLPSGMCFLPWGQTDEVVQGEDMHPDSSALLRTLLASWHLLRQRAVTTETAYPDRAALRRLKRSTDHANCDHYAVRVLQLRRSGASAGMSDREFHHRWIVRGHWRQQWYPSIEDHRPVWIMPHVKGPDDAPLLGGEKVYAS